MLFAAANSERIVHTDASLVQLVQYEKQNPHGLISREVFIWRHSHSREKFAEVRAAGSFRGVYFPRFSSRAPQTGANTRSRARLLFTVTEASGAHAERMLALLYFVTREFLFKSVGFQTLQTLPKNAPKYPETLLQHSESLTS